MADWLRADGFEFKRARRSAYEDTVVRKLCQEAGFNYNKFRIEVQERYGVPEPRLAHFEQDYELPWPLRFRIGRLTNLFELTVSDLYKSFGRTPLVKSYFDLLDAVVIDDPRPVVMVFSWPKVHRFMTLSEAPANVFQVPEAVTIMAPVSLKGRRPLLFCLTSLDEILRTNHE